MIYVIFNPRIVYKFCYPFKELMRRTYQKEIENEENSNHYVGVLPDGLWS